MIETTLTVTQNASVTLSRAKPGEKSADSQKTDEKDVEDTVDLNVGFSLAEGLKNAESEEDLLKMLKEGQAQAQESINKFRDLADKRLGGENGEFRSNPQDVIFDSVRDVVVSLMQDQGKPAAERDTTSFETRLAVAIQERDPEMMDRIRSKITG